MTAEQAHELYIRAGGPSDHSSDEWACIHEDIEGIVAAKSDRAAGRTIEWWGCWDSRYTAKAFATRVREMYRREKTLQPQTCQSRAEAATKRAEAATITGLNAELVSRENGRGCASAR